MPDLSIVQPAAVPIEILDGEAAEDNVPDVLRRKCGRCRLSFVRYSSSDLDESTSWWLCPQCRTRLLGEASKMNSRWA